MKERDRRLSRVDTHAAYKKAKPSMNEKRREAFINTLTVSFAFFVLILLMMLLIGPYLLKIIG